MNAPASDDFDVATLFTQTTTRGPHLPAIPWVRAGKLALTVAAAGALISAAVLAAPHLAPYAPVAVAALTVALLARQARATKESGRR